MKGPRPSCANGAGSYHGRVSIAEWITTTYMEFQDRFKLYHLTFCESHLAFPPLPAPGFP